nr:hypothetical protein [Tanacetum cinerariifolium]
RTKTAQQTKINDLERRVKKLEKKQRSRTLKLKILYKVGLTVKVISSSDDEALDKEDTSKQGRIVEIDIDEDITLVNDQKMFDADKDLQGEEVVVEQEAACKEQQELNEEEKDKLFMEHLEKRKKFFVAKRTEEKGIYHPQKLNKGVRGYLFSTNILHLVGNKMLQGIPTASYGLASTFSIYLQNEHHALWEVIEFGDSYKAPIEETGKSPASESSARKKGMAVAITMEDMQKSRNDG